MFDHQTSLATPNVTSSRESVSGATHCGAPATPTPDLYGRGVALASLSAAQDKAKDLQIPATCGQPSSTSSKSAALLSSLVSKLTRRLNLDGGI